MTSNNISHYTQIEKVGESFSTILSLPYNIAFDLSAHGDKCYQYEDIAKEFGIDFYQLCMVYLISYHKPYSDTCRNTPNGFVDMRTWLRMMLKNTEILNALNTSIYQA